MREHGDIKRVEVRFFVYEDVIDELTFAAEYRKDVSLAVLLGSFAIDEHGPYVEVSGFEEFLYVGEERSLYAKTRSAMSRVMAQLGQGTGVPDHHVVGLFVSVPGAEAQLTHELARTHLSLFNVPFQMALSFDPDVRQMAAFVRPPRGRFENTPFWTVGAAGEPEQPPDDMSEEAPDEPTGSLASTISDAVDESR